VPGGIERLAAEGVNDIEDLTTRGQRAGSQRAWQRQRGFRVKPTVAIAGFVAAAALGYGGVQFALSLSLPVATAAPEASLASAPGTAATPEEAAGMPEWPAVFGVPEPEPTAAPVAPVATEYRLMGLVLGEGRRWAIVAHEEGETLARVGSVLPGGERVRSIDDSGVVISRGADTAVIGFEDDRLAGGAGLAALMSPRQPDRAEIPLSAVAGRDLRRVFGRAGTVRMVRAEGREAAAAEILWVRPGEILERIGLRDGDRVLRVNGFAAGDLDALSQVAGQIGRVREYEIALRRSGVLRTITVVLTDGG